MFRKIVFLLLACCFWFESPAQYVSPDLLNSGGQTFTAGEYSLSFSVGEVAINTLSAESMTLTQGFFQPLHEVVLRTASPNSSEIAIYPNPVEDLLYFTLGSTNNAKVKVYDSLGRIIYDTKVTDNFIDMSGLQQGLYVISIQDNHSKSQRIFKILKK